MNFIFHNSQMILILSHITYKYFGTSFCKNWNIIDQGMSSFFHFKYSILNFSLIQFQEFLAAHKRNIKMKNNILTENI